MNEIEGFGDAYELGRLRSLKHQHSLDDHSIERENMVDQLPSPKNNSTK
jgi:hypothetical protein